MRPRGWLVPRGANPEGVGSLEQWLVRSSGESCTHTAKVAGPRRTSLSI